MLTKSYGISIAVALQLQLQIIIDHFNENVTEFSFSHHGGNK